MRFTKWSTALLCGIALTLTLPAVAQDDAIPKELPPPPSEPAPPTPEPEAAPAEPVAKKADYGEPPLHRWGGWTIAVAAWQPSLIGADEELTTTYTNGIAYPIMGGSTARTRETVAVSYHLPKNVGSIDTFYSSMDQSDYFEQLTPGQFIFGETRAYPIVPGAFDDGLADGYSASIARKTREFRLQFSQTAFENPRAKGTWGIGYRQVSHSRNLLISYLALVPNLPPIMPPVVPDNADPNRLDPFSDQVSQTANFSGHGLGVSFDLVFPVARRVSVISGLSLGLIRGSASSAYSSLTSYYYLVDAPGVPLTQEELFTILQNPPCNDPNDPVCETSHDSLDVDQAGVVAALTQTPTSQFAETIDIYVGLEVWVWKGLKVFGTLRDVYYANVGEYVVPRPGLTDVRTPLSAGYEGYTLGLSWRF